MRNQKGFTLIELVVVIVILGILAAVAVPKFVDMQVDAKISAAKGMQAAVNSAAALAHAQALVKSATSSVDMEGSPVDLVNGYPSAVAGGIDEAVNAEGFTFSSGDFLLNGEVDCGARYVASAGSGAFPTITLLSSGCN